jgi:hypothetical protein
MSASGEGLVLRVFTHPACAGCSTAVKRAWELAESQPELKMRTVSLERKEGLAEARSESVTTIPTTILSNPNGEIRRWTGTPEADALREILAVTPVSES